VLERSTIGVLGVITAGLALAALAAQPASPATPIEPQTLPARVVSTPSSRTLRALRDGTRIDVNRAAAADLELLPGVGPTLARRIIEQREARGPFRTSEDLLQVRGIGRRTLERLQPLLAFEAAGSAAHQRSNIQTTPAVTAK
jgi:competence ComEA-like helix-hairpin-helix protein